MEFQSRFFVNHSPNVYANLDAQLTRAIQHRRICPIVGSDGSGKTWMLRYWLTHSVYAPHSLYVRMYHSTMHTHGDSADKATLICFSAIDHLLQLRALKETGLMTDRESMNTSSLWTKQQYYRLFHSLSYKLKKQHIHTLIIDQAQHLTPNTWEELVALRDQCNESIALIPCLSYRSSGSGQEAWEYLAKRLRSSPIRPVDVPIMAIEHLKGTLIELWTKHDIVLDPEVHTYMVSIAEKVWTITQGDWHALMGVQTTLDDLRTTSPILTMSHIRAMLEQYGVVKKHVSEKADHNQ